VNQSSRRQTRLLSCAERSWQHVVDDKPIGGEAVGNHVPRHGRGVPLLPCAPRNVLDALRPEPLGEGRRPEHPYPMPSLLQAGGEDNNGRNVAATIPGDKQVLHANYRCRFLG
jgi:hypothetical protein